MAHGWHGFRGALILAALLPTGLLRPATPAVAGSTGPVRAGMVTGDTDPEHTPLAWEEAVRPALDYGLRSFGLDLGSRQRVRSVTLVADTPTGECRIDREHAQLYYGEENGKFRCYAGPLRFTKERAGGALHITLSHLRLTTRMVKVRLNYADDRYTAVANSVAGAIRVNEGAGGARLGDVRVLTVVQGRERLLPWRVELGEWRGDGRELACVATPESDLRSGEGGRVLLAQVVSGDLDLACEFLIPGGSSGAGGPVIYFGMQPSGAHCAFRYVNGWGTAVLQSQEPGQPWTQVGYATGKPLPEDRWHRLRLYTEGQRVHVELDGQPWVEGECRSAAGRVGLGCQVRPVRFRHIRVSGASMAAARGRTPSVTPPARVVVCADAGRGRYQAFPGLCRLRSGDLLAVFYAGWGHVSRPGERLTTGGAIALSRSVDDGKTWTPAQVVLDTRFDDRDPAVWQCDDGTVCVSSASVDWARLVPPYEEWCRAYTVRSTDEGRTWAQPEELTVGDRRDFTVWTEPRRLSTGDWLWPVYRNHNTECTAAFLRSTDGGRTWSEPRFLDEQARTTDEPDVCELPDGTLFCAMRPGPEPHMWGARSSDGGRTWSRPEALPFYGHCSNLLQTRSGVTLLAHRDPGMSLHYSLDGARTWAGAVMIDACGGAYSQMVELPDGRVLIVYYTEGARSEVRAQFLKVTKAGISAAKAGDRPAGG